MLVSAYDSFGTNTFAAQNICTINQMWSDIEKLQYFHMHGKNISSKTKYHCQAVKMQWAAVAQHGSPFAKDAFTTPKKPDSSNICSTCNRRMDPVRTISMLDQSGDILIYREAKLIKVLQKVQLGLRVMVEIGGCGLLFCAVVLKIPQEISSYVIRLTPAAELLASGFAIYHLCRAVIGRNSTKSKAFLSYTLANDAAFVSLYGFLAVVSKANQHGSSGSDLRWTSFDNRLTGKITVTVWLISLVLGSIHCVSAIISLYLLSRLLTNMQRLVELDLLRSEPTSVFSKKHKHKISGVPLPLVWPDCNFQAKETIFSPEGGGEATKSSTENAASPLVGPDPTYLAATPTRTASSVHDPCLSSLQFPIRYDKPRNFAASKDNRIGTLVNGTGSHSSTLVPRPLSCRISPVSPESQIFSVWPNASTTADVRRTPPIPRKSSKRCSGFGMLDHASGFSDDVFRSVDDSSSPQVLSRGKSILVDRPRRPKCVQRFAYPTSPAITSPFDLDPENPCEHSITSVGHSQMIREPFLPKSGDRIHNRNI